MTVAAAHPSSLLPAALTALCVLLRCGCVTSDEAWAAVNGPVLLAIALSFALGKAIEESGLAASAATAIVNVVAPYGEVLLGGSCAGGGGIMWRAGGK
jgi:di/tricarboxylate transporter